MFPCICICIMQSDSCKYIYLKEEKVSRKQAVCYRDIKLRNGHLIPCANLQEC